MNRRDFLKLSPLAFAPLLKADVLQQSFDLAAAFANAPDGGVIDIPPGDYLIFDTLSLANKSRVTVYANNARIWKSGDFTDKTVLNMAGAKYCNIYGLTVETGTGDGLPLAALVRGRTAESDGGGCAFYDCNFSGNYTGATVYSVCSEGDSYHNCSFQTETDKPAFIDTSRDILNFGLVESSNDCLWFSHCTFKNYSNAPVLFLADGTVSDLSVKDSYVYLGNAGTFVQTNGDSGYITLQDIRAEGEGNCLLLDNVGTGITRLHISNIAWTIPSEYMIQSAHNISESELNFLNFKYTAAKFIHMTGGILWECLITGNKAGGVVLDTGAQSRGTKYIGFSGHPISESYDNNANGNLFMLSDVNGSRVIVDTFWADRQ